MPDIKIDDNCLLEVERKLNVHINSNKLEQLENQHGTTGPTQPLAEILIPEQHGFRPRLSTTHQLLRVVEYIKEGNNWGQCTAAVFLDIQKAFDRVWHTGLLFKLINYNIPTLLILFIKSYISNRTFSVKINRTFSQTRSISAGIAEGSILGPVLFHLYVNDILKCTNTLLCRCADDAAILSRHENLNSLVEKINEHLAHLEIWFSVWKKSHSTLQKQRQYSSRKESPPLKLLSKIKESPGLTIPNILVSTLIKLSLSDNTLHKLELSLKMQRINITPLSAASLNFFRRNFKIPTIRQTIRKISTNFFNTVGAHDNPSIQDIPNYLSHFSVRRSRDVLVNPDFD
ncbi:RNA-directed DNA polymerase from mobile element jockey [Trichonephila clavipes]|nr:RNA-directed DNA polymerase from mobile element jockey [Trichonephila clavipes]